MTFSVLIADDEPPARSKVKRLLQKDPRFHLAGEAGDGTEALARIETLKPELLILDVQMPGLDGFEVLAALGSTSAPAVIFSTAYDAYALRAFDTNAIDYLLKPYHRERFQRALDKAHLMLASGARGEAELEQLITSVELRRFVVKIGEAWVPIKVEDVFRISAEDKYVRIHTKDGEHLVRQSIRALEQRLDAKVFVRVHRSELVQLDAIAKMEPWTHGDAILVLKNGTTLVLSRSYRQSFLDRWSSI